MRHRESWKTFCRLLHRLDLFCPLNHCIRFPFYSANSPDMRVSSEAIGQLKTCKYSSFTRPLGINLNFYCSTQSAVGDDFRVGHRYYRAHSAHGEESERSGVRRLSLFLREALRIVVVSLKMKRNSNIACSILPDGETSLNIQHHDLQILVDNTALDAQRWTFWAPWEDFLLKFCGPLCNPFYIVNICAVSIFLVVNDVWFEIL